MVMKFKSLKSIAPTDDLKYLLHKYLTGFDQHRGYRRIHASEMTKEGGICPRLYALADVVEFELPERAMTTSEEVTFEIGRMVQDKVVHWYSDMGKAISNWKCLSCETVVEFSPRPDACKCGCKAFKPEEPRFTSKVSGASCGIDMLYVRGDGKWEIVEIKTIDKDEFKKLVAPLAEHRMRTNFYMRIVAESGHPMASKIHQQRGRVLYVSKGGYGAKDDDIRKWGIPEYFSPFKQFDVSRVDAQTHEMVRRGKAVADFRAGRAGMPCGVCKTAFTDRAKECPAKKPCFSGKYPAENDWQ